MYCIIFDDDVTELKFTKARTVKNQLFEGQKYHKKMFPDKKRCYPVKEKVEATILLNPFAQLSCIFPYA